MNQGPFYESGTMTASVTKSEEEAQEPEKHVSNWVSQVSGRACLKAAKNRVQQKKGWGDRLPRTEIKSCRPTAQLMPSKGSSFS